MNWRGWNLRLLFGIAAAVLFVVAAGWTRDPQEQYFMLGLAALSVAIVLPWGPVRG